MFHVALHEQLNISLTLKAFITCWSDIIVLLFWQSWIFLLLTILLPRYVGRVAHSPTHISVMKQTKKVGFWSPIHPNPVHGITLFRFEIDASYLLLPLLPSCPTFLSPRLLTASSWE